MLLIGTHRGGQYRPARTPALQTTGRRYDMITGSSLGYDSDACLGEVVFVPRPGGTDELDGYYLTFATSLDNDRSWPDQWHASASPAPPQARVLDSHTASSTDCTETGSTQSDEQPDRNPLLRRSPGAGRSDVLADRLLCQARRTDGELISGSST